MKLLVDIGNCRLKWAVTHGGDDLDGPCGVIELKRDFPPDLAQFSPLDRPASIWASCVAPPAVRHALVEYARRKWSLEPVFIHAQKRQAGIVNGYSAAKTLGSDRWAALIAACTLFPRQPVIVVDAGTAVTVDLLDGDGFFRGGVIFPGVRGMGAALHRYTENLASHQVDGAAAAPAEVNSTAIATDTGSAIAGGTLLAVAGGIELAVARQRQSLQAQCRIIATGGDAERIVPLLTGAVEIVPQLVLRGLAIISRWSLR